MKAPNLRRFSDQFSDVPNQQKDQVILQLQLLLDITRKVASYDVLDEAFESLERIIASSIHSEKANIYIYQTSDSELYRRLSSSDKNAGVEARNSFTQVDKCFTSGKSCYYNQLQGIQYTHHNISNFACSLLTSTKGEKLGVVQVINKFSETKNEVNQDVEFDDSDLKLLGTLGQHLGATLESVIRNEKANQVHDEELQLLNVVAEVTTDLDLFSMIQKIIFETIRILRAERATVFLFDEQTDELFSHVGTGIESREIRIPSNTGIAGEVFTKLVSINIPYAYADLRFNPTVDKMTGFFTRSILCVPLINTKGKCIGVTQVLNKNSGHFTSEDETRLKAFTTQIAVGIENAKLFNDVQNIKNYIESMLQSMSNAVITLDCDNKIATCNHAAEKLFGLTEVELLSQVASTIFCKENQWLIDAVRTVNDNRESFDTVDVELIINQNLSSVNVHIHPLVSVDGENLGTVLMLEDISHEKRLKTTMARYMDPRVANQLIEEGEIKLGGESVNATILFSDIRDFTSISEKLGPQGTVSFLNHFFTDMVNCIQEQDGMVNKFIGDALMAVYGVPVAIENEADMAVKSAIAMSLAVRVLNQKKSIKLGGQSIDIGIGINSDSVVYGNIGSPKRMDFTVIGDGVNLASRIEGACKYYASRILISENTYKALKGTYRLREIDKVIVKGKLQPISLYQVLDCYSESEFPNLMEVVQITQEGLKSYRRKDWNKAIYYFNEILRLHPKDRIAELYIERCKVLEETPPDDDWDGVWRLTEK